MSANSKLRIADWIQAAEKNSWILIDSLKVSQSAFKGINVAGKPIIQLPLTHFYPNPKKRDYKSPDVPRWITTDLTLYRFKTNWLLFDPGTNDATTENGFILRSDNGEELTIYHLWGE